jgi:hypothetical protein
LLVIVVQADDFIAEETGMIFEWSGDASSPMFMIRPFPSFKGELD